MQSKIREKTAPAQGGMEGENLQQGLGGEGQGEVIIDDPIEYKSIEEKVPVEIRDEIYVKLDNAGAVRRSFEEWSKQWD